MCRVFQKSLTHLFLQLTFSAYPRTLKNLSFNPAVLFFLCSVDYALWTVKILGKQMCQGLLVHPVQI
jgi:hypothetical protein